MRYPRAYAWFVGLATLDIILTWVVLEFGGQEVNAVADYVIQHRGLQGIVLFKFCLVVFVIVMCEVVGRRRDSAGRRLAKWCVAVTAIPVVAAFAQLLVIEDRGETFLESPGAPVEPVVPAADDSISWREVNHASSETAEAISIRPYEPAGFSGATPAEVSSPFSARCPNVNQART